MRNLLSVACLVVFLSVAMPAQAQLRENVASTQQSPARLYDAGTGFSLNKLFDPQHFQMHHSYEMSVGSYGGNTSSLGMYTNTMMWQFNQKLAARVDLSIAHSLFGGDGFGYNASGLGSGNGAKVFLRNAEIVYRPRENMMLHIQVHQSPYGSYASPFGYDRYFGQRMYGGFGSGSGLFWNDGPR